MSACRNQHSPLGAPASHRQQTRQLGVGTPVAGPQHQRERVARDDFGANQQLQIGVAGCGKGPDHTGQGVFIGHRQRGVSQCQRLGHQFIGVGVPARNE